MRHGRRRVRHPGRRTTWRRSRSRTTSPDVDGQHLDGGIGIPGRDAREPGTADEFRIEVTWGNEPARGKFSALRDHRSRDHEKTGLRHGDERCRWRAARRARPRRNSSSASARSRSSTRGGGAIRTARGSRLSDEVVEGMATVKSHPCNGLARAIPRQTDQGTHGASRLATGPAVSALAGKYGTCALSPPSSPCYRSRSASAAATAQPLLFENPAFRFVRSRSLPLAGDCPQRHAPGQLEADPARREVERPVLGGGEQRGLSRDRSVEHQGPRQLRRQEVLSMHAVARASRWSRDVRSASVGLARQDIVFFLNVDRERGRSQADAAARLKGFLSKSSKGVYPEELVDQLVPIGVSRRLQRRRVRAEGVRLRDLPAPRGLERLVQGDAGRQTLIPVPAITAGRSTPRAASS